MCVCVRARVRACVCVSKTTTRADRAESSKFPKLSINPEIFRLCLSEKRFLLLVLKSSFYFLWLTLKNGLLFPTALCSSSDLGLLAQ